MGQLCMTQVAETDLVVVFAVVKGNGAGVTIGVHQETDLEAARDNLRQLNPFYPGLRFLYLQYTALRPQDAVAFMRVELRELPQSPWGDYNRTYTLETELQIVMEKLAVPKLLARRVPPVYGLLLTWIDEDVTGVSWNYSKDLVSYPPLKCLPPGEVIAGSAGGGSENLPAIENLAVTDLAVTELTGNTITADRITLHGVSGTTVITADGLSALRNAEVVTAASVLGNITSTTLLSVPLEGDQTQAWYKVTGNTGVPGIRPAG